MPDVSLIATRVFVNVEDMNDNDNGGQEQPSLEGKVVELQWLAQWLTHNLSVPLNTPSPLLVTSPGILQTLHIYDSNLLPISFDTRY